MYIRIVITSLLFSLTMSFQPVMATHINGMEHDLRYFFCRTGTEDCSTSVEYRYDYHDENVFNAFAGDICQNWQTYEVHTNRSILDNEIRPNISQACYNDRNRSVGDFPKFVRYFFCRTGTEDCSTSVQYVNDFEDVNLFNEFAGNTCQNWQTFVEHDDRSYLDNVLRPNISQACFNDSNRPVADFPKFTLYFFCRTGDECSASVPYVNDFEDNDLFNAYAGKTCQHWGTHVDHGDRSYLDNVLRPNISQQCFNDRTRPVADFPRFTRHFFCQDGDECSVTVTYENDFEDKNLFEKFAQDTCPHPRWSGYVDHNDRSELDNGIRPNISRACHDSPVALDSPGYVKYFFCRTGDLCSTEAKFDYVTEDRELFKNYGREVCACNGWEEFVEGIGEGEETRSNIGNQQRWDISNKCGSQPITLEKFACSSNPTENTSLERMFHLYKDWLFDRHIDNGMVFETSLNLPEVPTPGVPSPEACPEETKDGIIVKFHRGKREGTRCYKHGDSLYDTGFACSGFFNAGDIEAGSQIWDGIKRAEGIKNGIQGKWYKHYSQITLEKNNNLVVETSRDMYIALFMCMDSILDAVERREDSESLKDDVRNELEEIFNYVYSNSGTLGEGKFAQLFPSDLLVIDTLLEKAGSELRFFNDDTIDLAKVWINSHKYFLSYIIGSCQPPVDSKLYQCPEEEIPNLLDTFDICEIFGDDCIEDKITISGLKWRGYESLLLASQMYLLRNTEYFDPELIDLLYSLDSKDPEDPSKPGNMFIKYMWKTKVSGENDATGELAEDLICQYPHHTLPAALPAPDNPPTCVDNKIERFSFSWNQFACGFYESWRNEFPGDDFLFLYGLLTRDPLGSGGEGPSPNPDNCPWRNQEDEFHRLTVRKQGSGAVTIWSDPRGIDLCLGCGTESSESYPAGSVVALKALSQPDSHVASITGDTPDCADGKITMTRDITCTYTVSLNGPDDGDGIAPTVDGAYVNGGFVDESATYSSSFTDRHIGGKSFGYIKDRGGLHVAVEDSTNPAHGLLVQAWGTGDPAEVKVCGDSTTYIFNDGRSMVVTCGSSTIGVRVGPIESLLADGTVAMLPTGAQVRLTEFAAGHHVIENQSLSGTEPIVIELQDQVIELDSGKSVLTNQPPVAQCQNTEIITAPGACTASPDADTLSAAVGSASFDPEGEPITLSLASNGPYDLGNNEIALISTDLSGLSDACSAMVTVTDGEPPLITCPTDQIVECTGYEGTTVSFSATASDNCSMHDLNCDPPSGAPFSLESTPISCVASDGSGNLSSCNANIMVRDTTPPVIALHGESEVTLECGVDTWTDPGVTVSDVCDPNVPVVMRGATVDPATPNADGYVVTYDATDASSNPAPQVTRTVAVTDTLPPVITLNDGVEAITLECGGVLMDPGGMATDACDLSVPVVSNAENVVNLAALGSYDVTYTAIDDSGNQAAVIRTFQVADHIPPAITSITASPSKLWPPNHKMIPVRLSVDVSDRCDPEPFCRIIDVSSNEQQERLGDGHTLPDWEITDDLVVNLRAERSGAGDGRIYAITVECTDTSGNATPQTVAVTVPHNQRQRKKR